MLPLEGSSLWRSQMGEADGAARQKGPHPGTSSAGAVSAVCTCSLLPHCPDLTPSLSPFPPGLCPCSPFPIKAGSGGARKLMAGQGVGVQQEEGDEGPPDYTHPSRKSKDSLQIRRCEDVSAHHRGLEARGIGFDAVEHWVPNGRETRRC